MDQFCVRVLAEYNRKRMDNDHLHRINPAFGHKPLSRSSKKNWKNCWRV